MEANTLGFNRVLKWGYCAVKANFRPEVIAQSRPQNGQVDNSILAPQR